MEGGKQFRSAVKAVGLDRCGCLPAEILYSVTSCAGGGVENRRQELRVWCRAFMCLSLSELSFDSLFLGDCEG